MADRDDKHGRRDTHSGVGEQSKRNHAGAAGGQQGGLGGQEEGNHDDAGAQRAEDVPQGGLNPEVGDMDAAADPEHDPGNGDNGLPGKAGGGLIGG